MACLPGVTNPAASFLSKPGVRQRWTWGLIPGRQAMSEGSKAMARKQAELLSIAISWRCACDEENTCTAELDRFSAIVQECEDCGEHGHVETTVRCKACGKYHTLIINRW